MTTPPSPASFDAWRTFSGKRRPGPLGRVLALDDFEHLAARRLPRPLFGYVAGGAETCAARDGNRTAFADWSLAPRVLRNVSMRSTRTTLFGREYACPFGVAPMGIAALSAYDGDRVLARAAHAANIPFVLSGASLTRLEDVVQAAPHSWFQVYLPGDPAKIEPLLNRAARAGVDRLVVTVDVPVAGNRENNVRAGFSTPLRPSARLAIDGLTHPRWLAGTWARTLLTRGMPHFENSFAGRGAPILSRHVERDFSRREHLDWSHLAQVRELWRGPLVVKGILDPEDAATARRVGADGIIVSNHGGRQLDGAVAPLRVLSEVVAAAGGMPVMLDGGIRRGSDVVKALALGACFVFVGRPFNYAAAVAGESGVTHAIALLHEELDRNLALLGVDSPARLERRMLRHTSSGRISIAPHGHSVMHTPQPLQ